MRSPSVETTAYFLDRAFGQARIGTKILVPDDPLCRGHGDVDGRCTDLGYGVRLGLRDLLLGGRGPARHIFFRLGTCFGHDGVSFPLGGGDDVLGLGFRLAAAALILGQLLLGLFLEFARCLLYTSPSPRD